MCSWTPALVGDVGTGAVAVAYHKDLETLLVELTRMRLRPEVVSASSPTMTAEVAEISVKGDLVVHFDKASRSVWVDGSWPESSRLEAKLQKVLRPKQRRSQRRRLLLGFCVAVVLMLAVYLLIRERSELPPSIMHTDTAPEVSPPAAVSAGE